MRTRTPATSPRARALVVLLTLLALLSPASTAFADVTEPGGASGNQGGGPTKGKGKDNAGNLGCTAKDERTENGTVFTRPGWPTCQDGRWSTDFTRGLCPTGLLVYRFYGKRSGKLDAVTASRVNLANNNCGATAFPGGRARLYYPNAMDADNVRRAPFVVRNATNVYGETLAFAEPTAPKTGKPVQYLTTDRIIYSKAAPGTNCQSYQRDPLAEVFRTGTAEQKAYYSSELYKLYNARRQLGYRTALTYTGAREANDSSKTVTYHDNVRCSSPWDFTIKEADLKAKNYANQPVVGTCFVYLERRGTKFTGTNTSGQRETRYGFQLKDPEAIARFNKVNTGQKPRARAGETNLPNYFTNWRAHMKAYAPELGGAQPHQIYEGAGRQAPLNRAKSAQQIAERAYCVEAPRAIFGANVSLDNPPPPPPPGGGPGPGPGPGGPAPAPGSGEITVEVPDVFQVGGTQRPGKVTATTGTLSPPPGYHPHSLSYTVVLTGVGGYIDCRGNRSRSCEFEVTRDVGTDPRHEGTAIRQRQDIEAVFYSAGNTAKKIKVEVTNRAGQFHIRHTHQDPCTTSNGVTSCPAPYNEDHYSGFTPSVVINHPNATPGATSVLVDVVGANNQTNVR